MINKNYPVSMEAAINTSAINYIFLISPFSTLNRLMDEYGKYSTVYKEIMPSRMGSESRNYTVQPSCINQVITALDKLLLATNECINTEQSRNKKRLNVISALGILNSYLLNQKNILEKLL